MKSSYTAAVVLNWGVLVADGSCKVYLIMLKMKAGPVLEVVTQMGCLFCKQGHSTTISS